MIGRRAFIGILGAGALAAPRVTSAQSRRNVARIGILGLGATSNMTGPQPRASTVDALLRGLRELGYVYGRDFVTEPRGADGKQERVPDLAGESVRLQVDVIVAPG